MEVLIGHGICQIINETDTHIENEEIEKILDRICHELEGYDYLEVKQDKHLAKNQEKLHCGDNGIFKGMPLNNEETELVCIANEIYQEYKTDGKYILNGKDLIICQSNADSEKLRKEYPNSTVNPLGEWTGGINVDSGATNRKLGSDMGEAITGGGLHGKDLSKADVSVNIYCHLLAQDFNEPVEAYCSIGSDYVNVKIGETFRKTPFDEIVDTAKSYVDFIGGFEKLAEWGLI